MSLDMDWEIRLAALKQADRLRHLGQGVATSANLNEGFEYLGERIALWNPRRGIWRPTQLADPGAALSVFTAPRVRGRAPAYDDEVAADDRGWFGYMYEGSDPLHWTNVAVRNAMRFARPIIYLYGLTPGHYEVISPVFVTGEDEARGMFHLEADVSSSVADPLASTVDLNAARRQYQTVAVKKRVHQHRFREYVLGAYRMQCAICRLKHAALLDAAHIIPDRDDRGLPLVSNGVSLCKIHHSAFDANILGIAPELVVRIRADILAEIDGPMLQHGLKEMDGVRIGIPRREEFRPNRDFLAERFEQFRAA